MFLQFWAGTAHSSKSSVLASNQLNLGGRHRCSFATRPLLITMIWEFGVTCLEI